MSGGQRTSTGRARVVLVGVHGHGRAHLRTIERLVAAGRASLVGVCDVQQAEPSLSPLLAETPIDGDLGRLLSRTRPDVTVVCTPIHTHVTLATQAIEAGSAVLLEKPPAPTVADHEQLRAAAEAAGVACQIGFQSFGSLAVAEAERVLRAGHLGEVRGIGAAGAWVRTTAYWSRASWAGRRSLDGQPVVDGVLTNPFAHATATALRLDGSDGEGGIETIELELHRAHDIDADDTSCVTVTTASGTRIVVAATLCARTSHDPFIEVQGTRGRLRLHYKTHRLAIETGAAVERTVHGEIGLLDNLIDHLADPTVALLAPLSRTLAFAQVIDAIRTSAAPTPIPSRYVEEFREAGQTRRVVHDIDATVTRCAEDLVSFSDLEVPWARPPVHVQPPGEVRT